ncbi:MAG: TonB-dependent receptor [Nostoc sp.]|uniref:TonB-dependent receptor domain-containing protein n=1 Tax=Nostoc sp. TaxID=1180 RepID=UPI002FF986F6
MFTSSRTIEPISLYFSYSKSFNPVIFGTSRTEARFQPEKGEQLEVGLKADLIPDKLSATLAFYDLAKQNVLVTDPEDSRFSIQTGEQKSRGVEFSLTGSPVKGWNIAVGYAYRDPATKLVAYCGGLKPTELVKVIDAFAERLIDAASFRE